MGWNRMKTYSFAYGSGTVELPLDEKNVIGELHGNAVAPLADIRAALGPRSTHRSTARRCASAPGRAIPSRWS